MGFKYDKILGFGEWVRLMNDAISQYLFSKIGFVDAIKDRL